jgi:amino acid permease
MIFVVLWSKNNIQQLPVVSMLIFTAIFTLIHLAIFGLYLQFSGLNINAVEIFQTVILPSMLINLIAAIPIYLLTNELQHWVYPFVEET